MSEEKTNKENSNENSSNKELRHKKQHKNKNNNVRKESSQEFENLLKQLEDQYNLDRKNIKVVKIKQRKISFKDMILSILIGYLLDLILIIALNGYLGFADYDIKSIFLFSFIFTTIETVLKQILMKFIFRLMLMSFGTVTIPLTIVSFIMAVLITPRLEINSTGRLILFFIIFMIIRLLIRMFIMRKNILKQQRGIKK